MHIICCVFHKFKIESERFFMSKCSDPCEECKPKHCECGKKVSFCKCQGEDFCKKKINCHISPDNCAMCDCNSSQDHFCPKCKKRYKCFVSCEKKFECGNCSDQKYDCKVSCENKDDCIQTHVHEIQGSTMISGCNPHNHRFATISGGAIKTCEGHVHEVKFKTDFAGHYHRFKGVTSNAIPLPNGKHTHFIKSCTSIEDSHKHEFEFSTMIENPTNC